MRWCGENLVRISRAPPTTQIFVGGSGQNSLTTLPVDTTISYLFIQHTAMPSIFGGNDLHKAARRQSWDEFCDLALENPRRLLERDEGGRTPFHVLVLNGAPTDLVADLIADEPRLLRMKDQQLNTVLHYACEYGCTLTMLWAILRAFPEAAYEKNRDGYLPVDLVKNAKMELAGFQLGLAWKYHKDQYEVVRKTMMNPNSWQEMPTRFEGVPARSTGPASFAGQVVYEGVPVSRKP